MATCKYFELKKKELEQKKRELEVVERRSQEAAKLEQKRFELERQKIEFSQQNRREKEIIFYLTPIDPSLPELQQQKLQEIKDSIKPRYNLDC